MNQTSRHIRVLICLRLQAQPPNGLTQVSRLQSERLIKNHTPFRNQ